MKRVKCLGCKVNISDSNRAEGLGEKSNLNDFALCKYCVKDKGPEIYFEKLEEVRRKQTEYSRLWTECQHCQNSLHSEVICVNVDCPIFYKRTKTKIDLQKLETQMKSLELEW